MDGMSDLAHHLMQLRPCRSRARTIGGLARSPGVALLQPIRRLRNKRSEVVVLSRP